MKAIWDAQDHRCAICGSEDPGGKKDWHLDHCHETGKIREFLCVGCNSGILGGCGDNWLLLERAIAYLQKHGVGVTCWEEQPDKRNGSRKFVFEIIVDDDEQSMQIRKAG